MPIQDVTAASFDRAVSEAHAAAVDASASWCAPCKVYSPIFERAAAEHPGVTFLKFDVDQEPELAQRLGIQSMPTTLFFLHGRLAGKVPGALRPPQLKELLRQLEEHHH